MIPVRFVVACENGHIDDFPWVEWAHTRPGQHLDDAEICDGPLMRLNYTGKAGLVGLVLKCESCDSRARSMMGSANPDSLRGWQCRGNRPWLGPSGRQECEPRATPRMLQRGATNLYFPKVASSILIPPHSSRATSIAEQYWWTLGNGINEDGSPDESRIRDVAERCQIDQAPLREAVVRKLSGAEEDTTAQSEERYRLSEYQALLGAGDDPGGEFVIAAQDLDAHGGEIRRYIEDIILVEKLAETRALAGLSRIKPPPYREFDRRDQLHLAVRPRAWLPAMRVYGEGIFVTISRQALQQWASGMVADRYQDVAENHTRICQDLGRTARALPPKFFLLHTLAHALIRRMSYECGYGSSSLRERVYCSDEPDGDMCGILVYTADGDSEGTMGGLVRLGRPGYFGAMLRGAVEDASWCSTDPLCIESRGQGIDSLNRAACHACALLPETSCEEGNRFLDRGALVGTPDNHALGFFAELLRGSPIPDG